MDLEIMTHGAALFAAALCMGMGAIGSAIGVGYSAGRSCEMMARQPDEQHNILRIMLIGQAQASSPSIFTLIIALLLLYMKESHVGVPTMGAFLGAAFSMGLGALGSGIGIGFTNAGAVEGVGRNPKTQGILLRTMLMGASVAESPSIFALVVSLSLVFSH